ncbi:MAG: nuclear transport factor 2 family protein [Pseudomonadota bacterium]
MKPIHRIALVLFLSLNPIMVAADDAADIERILLGIAKAADEGNWTLLEQKFADNVILNQLSLFDETGDRVTEDDVIAGWADLLPRFDRTEHRITDVEILAISRITARASSRFHAIYHRNGRIWEQTGRLHYLLKREGDAWVVTALDTTPEWQSGRLADLLAD